MYATSLRDWIQLITGLVLKLNFYAFSLLQGLSLAKAQLNPMGQKRAYCLQLCKKTLIDITISILAGKKAGELYSLHDATLAHGRDVTALAHQETPHQL